MMDFAKKYDLYLHFFEEKLAEACEKMHFAPAVLSQSMQYSLLSGGKRIRPVLFFATLEAFGMPYESESEIALALECIHTYSLIHDDLPAMDNDDFRRGRPSNHKMFGEGNAVLAGDALLSYAFDLLLKQCERGAKYCRAAQKISSAAGPDGMIAGQSADLFYEGKPAGEAELNFIVERKTGRLIAAPVIAAAILAGADEAAAREFGTALGILFQITDDLLDVKGDAAEVGKTLGKDEKEDKLTYIKVFGVAGAERLADEQMQCALNALRHMGGETAFLAELVAYVRRRSK